MKTRRGSETKTRMIQVAMDLFHKQGIHATSIDQILAASETGKSQFSYYFKNKEGLIHAVLLQFYGMLKSNQAPVKSKFESWEDLEQWFGRFVRFQKQTNFERSCPIGTIGSELEDQQDLLRQDIRLIFDLMNRSLVDFFNLMKGRGEIPADCDPQALADFCFCIMQGGLLVVKIRREPEPFENSVAHAIGYLKSLNKDSKALKPLRDATTKTLRLKGFTK